ncbi:hypothetical protein [Burkholderia ubonensis]|uniref:hypothetical protein n=1 Tax=Burkholderia ubonensis TaxID=101571 RepID=UPI000AE2142F|nr:hypothetical protein [Burkholderia ubonensis]
MKKGKDWHVDVKAQAGVNAESSLMHHLVEAAANVSGVSENRKPTPLKHRDIFIDRRFMIRRSLYGLCVFECQWA